ncbi:Clavaminate synthase-like protein [Macrolepiota fuliginosa MF-IS2]|uniref:Clavaminate synthase-like protein n=1 Tax=Macrolepiota fuliginosa MF-IS2 TaxID=1400762 RepID=A0A9P6C028_9AGAR|nr:Clavaminate synthase-like protein [Macrolepiota fuliginosa MF-IS2]
MAITTQVPVVPPYTPAPPTNADLDYADLPIIDLSKAATTEGRNGLVKQVTDAMTNQGFFYVVNHGYTPEQTKRIFDIANVPFEHVSESEKQAYTGTMETSGSFQGYKPRQYFHIDNGIRDQLEQYNINRDVTKRGHPQALRPLLPELEAFAKHNHFHVLHPILKLLAIGLELPEETLVNIHRYDATAETYARFAKYYPRSPEEEEKTKNVWLKGHTDIGTVTLLYSQPVASLQILTPEGKWKYARHIDNALLVNIGDAMEFLSGGFYRATIHRVIQPPPDQQSYTRLGAFYFAMSDDDIKLAPLAQSPVLQRVGIKRRFEDDKAPTMEQWRKSRTSAYGRSQLTKRGAVEEEVVSGVLVTHYN